MKATCFSFQNTDLVLLFSPFSCFLSCLHIIARIGIIIHVLVYNESVLVNQQHEEENIFSSVIIPNSLSRQIFFSPRKQISLRLQSRCRNRNIYCFINTSILAALFVYIHVILQNDVLEIVKTEKKLAQLFWILFFQNGFIMNQNLWCVLLQKDT